MLETDILNYPKWFSSFSSTLQGHHTQSPGCLWWRGTSSRGTSAVSHCPTASRVNLSVWLTSLLPTSSVSWALWVSSVCLCLCSLSECVSVSVSVLSEWVCVCATALSLTTCVCFALDIFSAVMRWWTSCFGLWKPQCVRERRKTGREEDQKNVKGWNKKDRLGGGILKSSFALECQFDCMRDLQEVSVFLNVMTSCWSIKPNGVYLCVQTFILSLSLSLSLSLIQPLSPAH